MTDGRMISAEALARLAIARASLLDDTASEVYLEALADLEPMLVKRACSELAREDRVEYGTAMPSVGTIRSRCEAMARRDEAERKATLLLPMPKSDEDSPRVFCRDCADEPSGFRYCWCQGSGDRWVSAVPRLFSEASVQVQNCGRTGRHDPHSYVTRCHCFEVNPVRAEQRRRRSKQVHQPSATARR